MFDCVIANPPFSLEKWGDDVWINDPYGRNFAGLPPAKSDDFTWVQHMIRSMAPRPATWPSCCPTVYSSACQRKARSGASSSKWTLSTR